MKTLIRYATGLLEQETKDEAWRVYMSDAVRQLVENVAKGIGGAWIDRRYCDIVDHKPADTRTTEQKFYDAISSMGFTLADERGDGA